MPLEAQGRFCSLCNKHVVDIRNLSFQEASAKIRQLPDAPCVAIPAAYLSQPPIVKRTIWKKTGLAILSLLALLIAPKANAQQKTAIYEARYSNQNTVSNTLAIQGQLMDNNTKKPIDYATIQISQDGKVIAQLLSDDEGLFAVNIPDSIRKTNKPFTIEVRSIGYLPFIVASAISPMHNQLNLMCRLQVNTQKLIILGLLIRKEENGPLLNEWGTEKTITRKQLNRLPY